MASAAESFGEALKSSPDLQSQVRGAGSIDDVAKVAQASGFDVSADDLIALYNSTSQSSDAASASSASLSDDQLKGTSNFSWNEKVSDSWGTTVACSCY